MGDDACARFEPDASPASYASRPASTALAKALAMFTGSAAIAIAVFTSTASAPISMARAAWLGAPMPASTTTGTFACSMMRRIISFVTMPLLVPIGAPSGITVAAPASSRYLQSRGSAWQYGRMTNPSLASSSVALSVSMESGRRCLGSGCISSFSQFVSKASRAICAARIASVALRAPEVLGRSCMPGCLMCCSMSSSLFCMSMRLSAIVTISVFDCMMDCSIVWFEGNFPVPSIRRELNSLPAIISLLIVVVLYCC